MSQITHAKLTDDWPAIDMAIPQALQRPRERFCSARARLVEKKGKLIGKQKASVKAGPPLDLSVWSFLTFLHHGIEEVKRYLL